MPKIVSATEARVRFGELLRRVGEERATYIVERAGERQVVILSIEEYEDLVTAARGARRRDAVEAAYTLGQRLRARRGGAPMPTPEDVIRSERDARDGDLADLR